MIDNKEKMVLVDDEITKVVLKYNDLLSFIVDINKNYRNMNLKVYQLDSNFSEPIIVTLGNIIKECNYEDRKSLLKKIGDLENEHNKVKNYKILDEITFEKYRRKEKNYNCIYEK